MDVFAGTKPKYQSIPYPRPTFHPIRVLEEMYLDFLVQSCESLNTLLLPEGTMGGYFQRCFPSSLTFLVFITPSPNFLSHSLENIDFFVSDVTGDHKVEQWNQRSEISNFFTPARSVIATVRGTL